MHATPDLVVDIGGTNTRVALSVQGTLQMPSIRRYRNADHSGLHEVLTKYSLETAMPQINNAAIAVAGPVENGTATLTNLDWHIDSAQVSKAIGANFSLIFNDLQAQGHSVGHVPEHALIPVYAAQSVTANGPQLVVNVGTGFNAVAVHDCAGRRLVPASESGHVGLPVETAADLRLSRFLARKHGFSAVEDVLSGRGLQTLYQWLASETGSVASLSGAEILAKRLEDPLARKTIDLFCRFFGIVTGDLALTHLPLGGIWLVGGVARALGPYLKESPFLDAYLAKGRFGPLVAQYPISAVDTDDAALIGCAASVKTFSDESTKAV